MNKVFRSIVGCMLLLAWGSFAQQEVRIKDVAHLSGLEDVQLLGYGLVVGLDGTGDRFQTVFTEQTVVNMLKNIGISVPERHMHLRNVAAVMVTGTLAPFKRKGTRFDITVSSMGDASSLEGGVLILTALQGPDAVVYASAQGPLSTGGYDVRNRGLSRVKKNHVMVGRIPGGAIVQREYAFNLLNDKDLAISLYNPDFTSALSMAQAINAEFEPRTDVTPADASAADAAAGEAMADEVLEQASIATVLPGMAEEKRAVEPFAVATDPSTIELNYGSLLARDSQMKKLSTVELLSRIENLTFEVSSQARVVINERTATVVTGGRVRISEVAVSHGGVKVEIMNRPQTVQPQPFTLGRTETVPNPEMLVEEKESDMLVLNSTTTVSDLSQALNSLGVAPRDIIAIIQAIKQAGALQAQLVIM